MEKTLFLPGGHSSTIQLMKDIAHQLLIPEHECIFHEYLYWQENSEPCVSSEISNVPHGHFDRVIAKSAGTAVFTKVVLDGHLSFDRALLLGVSFPTLTEFSLTEQDLLRLTLDNVLFVSQEEDFITPAAEVSKLSPPHLLEISGNDHLYQAFDLYTEPARAFLF